MYQNQRDWRNGLTKVIRLPISCSELKFTLLIGITVAFIACVYTIIVGNEDTEVNHAVMVVAILGGVFSGLGTAMGWIIYFIEKDPISIRCKCDND